MSIPQRAIQFTRPRQARSVDRWQALAKALEARAIVRDWRRRIATSSSWFVVQTEWEDDLKEARESWREAIWEINRL